MGKDNERFQGMTPDEIEREVANAYVMGAVDHGVVVDFGEVVDGACRETGVSVYAASGATLKLERDKRLVFDERGERMAKHGIPDKAELSKDDLNKQEETASNLIYALVEEGYACNVPWVVDHARFTTGVSERAAMGAVARLAHDEDLQLSWDGYLSQFPQNLKEE